jgi:drug/metabolite transporter (DMT)-like permease
MEGEEPKCTAASALLFIIALTAGTGCTVAAKSIFGLSGIGITGEVEHFRPPLFLTLMMFFGMAFALPAHFVKQAYRRRLARTDRDEAAKLAAEPVVTAKTYMLLAVPALFDLLATALMTAGLLSVDASVWQLLRGSAIILVAVMKHFVLLDHLTRAQWMGVLIITVATALVGASSLLGGTEDKAEDSVPTGSPLVGVALTMGGVSMTALQCRSWSEVWRVTSVPTAWRLTARLCTRERSLSRSAAPGGAPRSRPVTGIHKTTDAVTLAMTRAARLSPKPQAQAPSPKLQSGAASSPAPQP